MPDDVVAELRKKGLVGSEIDSIRESYTYGQLVAMLESNKAATMSYSDFQKHTAKNPIPLSPIELGAVDMAISSAGQYCRGLGNRVATQTGQILWDLLLTLLKILTF